MNSTALLLGVGALSLASTVARAQSVLPHGGTVAAGSINIAAPSGNGLTVTQSSARGVINWNSFSVGQQSSVTFVQPNASSATLNRVTGSTTSTIAGQIRANGQVYLVNPNGIAITKTGAVKVGGGFVGSTLGISDRDFMNGNPNFSGDGASAGVTNAGRIRTRKTGFVALVGGTVDNSGTISVPLGKVGLGSGERATLDLTGDGFLQVAVPTGATTADGRGLVDVSGKVQAAGGRVELRVATVATAIRDAVNVSGAITAMSVSGHDGSITLSGGDGGDTAVSGEVSASGGKNAEGGTIVMTGHDLDLAPTAVVNASGTTGGTILIGGDRQGGADPATKLVQQKVQTAATTRVAAGAKILANGTAGAGGHVVVWSDNVTNFAGAISATGGNGGFVETSSKGRLTVTDGATVDTLSPLGKAGTWLLDPATIIIASTGTGTLDQAADTTDTTSAVTISPATLNAATSNVILAASTSIAVNSAISLANAGVGITFEGAGTVGPSAGTALAANITTNNGAVAINGATVVGAAVTINAGTAGVTFAGAITGAKGLTVSGSGGATLGGSVTLTTTSGTLKITGPTTLGADVAITNTSNAALTFTGPVDGAHSLTITNGGAAKFAGTIGATTALTSLKTSGSGTATFGGNITTDNGLISIAGNMALSHNVIINAGTGAFSAAKNLTGAFALTMAGTGTATFGTSGQPNDQVAGLASLVTGPGTTIFNGSVSTNGVITVNGPTVIGGNIVVAAGATGVVTFSGPVDGAVDGLVQPYYDSLTTNYSVVHFNSTVGATNPLTNLIIGLGEVTVGGNITTAGAITFNSVVTLGGNLTANNAAITIGGMIAGATISPTTLGSDVTISSGTGLVTFIGTVDGNHGLTVTGSGGTAFNGAVGGATPLAGLTTGAGLTTFNGNVSTNGAITVNGATAIGATLAISAGAGAVHFAGAVDGVSDNAYALTISNSGATTFDSTVGVTHPLTGLTTGTGLTNLGGNIKVNGNIAFDGATMLTDDVDIDDGNYATSFAGAVDGAHNLTVTAAAGTDFGGTVGATIPLSSLNSGASTPSSNPGPTTTHGSITTTGGVTFAEDASLGGAITTTNSDVTITGITTLIGDVTVTTGMGAISFGRTVDGAFNLALGTSGAMLINGPTGRTTALAGLTTGTGQTSLNGDVVTTGAQIYGGPVQLLGPLVMDAGAGSITFAGTVQSSAMPVDVNSLTVASDGVATFNGAVDLGGELLRTGAGATIINATITTVSDQAYSGAVTLNASGLTATGGSIQMSGALTLSSDATITSGQDQVYQAIDGGHNLVLAGGTLVLNGAVGGTTPLASLTAQGAQIQLDGNIATSGAVTIGGPAFLGANLAISAGTGAVNFTGTIDGAFGLTVTNSGGTTFGGAVGATTRPTGLTTGTGLTTLSAALNVNGNILIGGATMLGTNVAIKNATGTLVFTGAVDGAHNLGVSANLGTSFGGAVGATTPLGTVILASAATLSGNVTTAGGQAYGGAVTLLGNSALATANAPLVFSSTIDTAAGAPANLTVTSGTGKQTYGGALGATGALGAVTLSNSNAAGISLAGATNNFASLNVSAGGAVTVADSGPLMVTGINTTGDILVATQAGDLTVTGAVTTTSATATALVLQAGKTASRVASPGMSDTSGNVVLDGGSLSVGTGGSGTIYTGSIANSTGLSAAVGLGNFRYWSDTNGNTGYTTALTGGISAVYREQPVVTVSAVVGSGRVYDTTTTIPILTVAGQVNGDSGSATGTITITGAGTSLRNAGSYVVGVTGVSMDASLAGLGYAAAGPSSSYVITPATLTYTANAATRTYGGVDPALSGTVSGFVGSDDQANATTGTLGFATGAMATSDVGSYAINGSGLTANNGNYLLVQASANATALAITPATITVNGATGIDKIYDATTALPGGVPGFSYSGVFGNNVTVSASGTAYASPNAGAEAVNVSGLTINGAASGNYVLSSTSVTGSGTITPATITITGATGIDKTYDTTTALPGGATGFIATGIYASDLGNVGVTAQGAAYAGPNAGAEMVNVSGLSISGAASGNYVLSGTSVTGSGAIGQATLTYTADGATRTYGGGNPVLSGTVSGFVGGDDQANATTGPLTFTTMATTSSNVGAYTINGGGLTANNGNYLFVEAAANTVALTITPTLLTVTGTKVYDTTTGFATNRLAVAGAQNGESVTLTSGTGLSASADVGSHAGNLLSGLAIAVAGGNALASNYSLPGSGTLAITPATITVAGATGIDKIYDATTGLPGGAAGFTATGIYASDLGNVAVTAQGAAYAGPNAGRQAVNISGLGLSGAASGNYVLSGTAVTGSGTIGQAVLSASLTGMVEKTYDGTLTAALDSSNYVISGFVGGQSARVTQASGSYASPDVGTGMAVNTTLRAGDLAAGQSTLLSNYVLPAAASGAVGKIEPATLTYVATPAARLVDTPNPAFVGVVTGFVAGETQASATTGTLVFASPAIASSLAGLYAIEGAGLIANAGNYLFVEAPGNATALRIGPILALGTSANAFFMADPFSVAAMTSVDAATPTSCTSGSVGETLVKQGSAVIFGPGGGC